MLSDVQCGSATSPAGSAEGVGRGASVEILGRGGATGFDVALGVAVGTRVADGAGLAAGDGLALLVGAWLGATGGGGSDELPQAVKLSVSAAWTSRT